MLISKDGEDDNFGITFQRFFITSIAEERYPKRDQSNYSVIPFLGSPAANGARINKKTQPHETVASYTPKLPTLFFFFTCLLTRGCNHIWETIVKNNVWSRRYALQMLFLAFISIK